MSAHVLDKANEARLENSVLTVLESNRYRVSISYLTTELRLRGWRGIDPRGGQFERLLLDLGFDIDLDVRDNATEQVRRVPREQYNGGTVLRTYVTVKS